MDIKKLNEDRAKVLSDMEQELTKELVPAEFLDENEVATRVLSVLLTDLAVEGLSSSGEFFFLPSQEDDEIQYFVNLITIAEELPEDTIEELTAALAMVNTFTLTGAFALDPVAKALIYKFTYPMPIDLSQEELYDKADFAMGLALSVVSEHGYKLVEVLEGDRTAVSVINSFANPE